ncbi:MAG: ParA family protein [Proteobacteria bacterium]|jgi:chromosome partitioning protein|nr:ParA family protein [Pseudomonadota bacterium]
MRSILIVNPKGGCGKTTLTTNLASFYAVWDVPVAIVDLDPQKSSLDWLRARPSHASKIHGFSGLNCKPKLPHNVRRVIYDVPARPQLSAISKLIDVVDVVLIPVLPSAIDVRVTAKFIADLLIKVKVRHKSVKVAIVGNRMQMNYKSTKELDNFLMNADIPFIAKLRASQKYVQSASNGLGIFDMLPSAVKQDVETWKPLLKWIEQVIIR